MSRGVRELSMSRQKFQHFLELGRRTLEVSVNDRKTLSGSDVLLIVSKPDVIFLVVKSVVPEDNIISVVT